MSTQPPVQPESDYIPQPLSTPLPDGMPLNQSQLIAPVWHTVLILAIILANSYFASARLSHNLQTRGKVVVYSTTIVWQIVLFGLVWIGLRLKKTRVRDLIGGQWKSVEDFLIDIGIAAAFWFISALILAGLKFALGLASLDVQKSTQQAKEAIGALGPTTGVELAVFVTLAIVAGFFEEIFFRGYLQHQIGALARNVYVGVAASAVIFGLGHGYQGARQMILIGVYGAMFGVLVVLRKSLRPGMMAHAWQDALSGIVIFILAKMGKM